jgi:alpha-beta hydrolase superfamily lysophospholipase
MTTATSTGHNAWLAGRRGVRLFGAVMAFFAVLTVSSHDAVSQGKLAEDGGTLPDGTQYLMRVPANWNGTLIRDLDYASGARSPRWAHLLEKGYALAGTGRHRLRLFRYDPAREIANLDRTLDMFEKRFRKPDRVIQYGCSGGGFVALGVAEDFSNRVDGVIATAAHIPVWQMNTFLDGWFVLKALIAPDLRIVDLPVEASGGRDHRVEGDIADAWRRAIDAAQETPEGRARIALAFTIGQWPAWVNRLTPQPNLEDIEALQHSMYHTVYQNASNPGGEARIRKELAADGQQLSWNTEVDYKQFFNNGNKFFQLAVRHLYQEAGIDLEADLARINAFPRVSASPYALDWWNAPGRTVKGNPKVPVLRMHEIGDYQIPVSLVQGYDDLIRANGKDDLYRTAYVNAPGHCGFTVAETMVAIETMMRRLDTGRWESTDPEQLNIRAKALHQSAARFIRVDRFAQEKYNRTWAPAARTGTMP